MPSDTLTVQVSAPHYWGFKYEIKYAYAEQMGKEGIIAALKVHMREFFEYHNLLDLRDNVAFLKLHIHDMLRPNDVVYACAC